MRETAKHQDSVRGEKAGTCRRCTSALDRRLDSFLGKPKKGADAGIDGKLFFHDDSSEKTKQIIFSVKAGKLNLSHVRDLRGVIEREHAEIGVLVTLNAPTPKMRAEAASAGFYTSHWGQHPRMQILTVAEILDGHVVNSPHLVRST